MSEKLVVKQRKHLYVCDPCGKPLKLNKRGELSEDGRFVYFVQLDTAKQFLGVKFAEDEAKRGGYTLRLLTRNEARKYGGVEVAIFTNDQVDNLYNEVVVIGGQLFGMRVLNLLTNQMKKPFKKPAVGSDSNVPRATTVEKISTQNVVPSATPRPLREVRDKKVLEQQKAVKKLKASLAAEAALRKEQPKEPRTAEVGELADSGQEIPAERVALAFDPDFFDSKSNPAENIEIEEIVIEDIGPGGGVEKKVQAPVTVPYSKPAKEKSSPPLAKEPPAEASALSAKPTPAEQVEHDLMYPCYCSYCQNEMTAKEQQDPNAFFVSGILNGKQAETLREFVHYYRWRTFTIPQNTPDLIEAEVFMTDREKKNLLDKRRTFAVSLTACAEHRGMLDELKVLLSELQESISQEGEVNEQQMKNLTKRAGDLLLPKEPPPGAKVILMTAKKRSSSSTEPDNKAEELPDFSVVGRDRTLGKREDAEAALRAQVVKATKDPFSKDRQSNGAVAREVTARAMPGSRTGQITRRS